MRTLNEYVIYEVDKKDYPQLEDSPSDKEAVLIYLNALQGIIDYAHFLNQKPTLGMFVPCDEDGNVLEEPINFNSYSNGLMTTLSPLYESCEQYHQALDKVLFDGLEVTKNSGTVIIVSTTELSVRFIQNVGVFVFADNHWKEIKTISDLCGYGLKYYEQ